VERNHISLLSSEVEASVF